MSEAPKVFITSFLNDIRRKFDSPEFVGGAITSVLGSADIDLREAKMKEAEAYMDITNVLGSVYIYPADNWDVHLDISEIAGRVKDRRKRSAAKKRTQKILYIRGATILGDVYIR